MAKKIAFSMIISRGVIVAGENDTVTYVSKLMNEHDIGAVVVLKGEKIVGIVSERDVVRRVVAVGLSPTTTRVAEVMTKDVVTAKYESGLDNIYRTLCSVKFRHLPILKDNKLIGIASQRDILYGLKMRYDIRKRKSSRK